MARRCLFWFLALLGLVLFAVAASLFILLPNIIAERVKEQLPLKDGSEALTKWKKVSVPIYLNVYVFNITNPEEVASLAPPILQEVGPFVFDETREKDIHSKENATIFYHDLKTFFFNAKRTNLSLDAEVYVANIPLITIADKLEAVAAGQISSLVGGVFQQMFDKHNEKVYTKRRVGDILFNGYRVDFFEDFEAIRQNFPSLPIRSPLPNNTFGIMYGKNRTSPGLFSLDTGELEVMDLKKVKSFKGRARVPHWTADTCNMINGTDGSAFHPQIKRKESLYIFNVDICRSAELQYERDSDVGGVNVYKFVMPDKFFLAPAHEPDNACFCTKVEPHHKLCTTDGILDISKCKKDAPIVISAPHFYKGSDELFEEVLGLQPVKHKHETFLEIEPMTGLVFNAARRIQINVHVKNNPRYDALKTVNNMIMPYIWIEETATADAKAIETYQSKIGRKLSIANALIICAMMVGVTLCLIFISLIILHSRKGRLIQEKPNQVKADSTSYSSLPQKEEFNNSQDK